MRTRIVIVFAIAVVGFSSSQSYAATKVFKNCTELNATYPGGVARIGAVNLGGVTKNIPKYDNAMYLANKKSDRDNDGIACEK
jgi:hypothetical protein